MKFILINIIKFYKKRIAKNLNTSCIFVPTCSEYAICALKKHNFLNALRLIIYRILRCNPLNKGGFDPVPDRQKILKWLI